MKAPSPSFPSSPRLRFKVLPPVTAAMIAVGTLSSLTAFSPTVEATDGIWLNNRTGTRFWEDPANWQGGTIADGADASVQFSANASATITANIANAPRTLGTITITGVTGSGNAISIAGANTLTLQTTGPGSRPVFNIGGTIDQGLSIGSTVNLTGTQGFEKIGNGRLSINGASTISGTIRLTEGSINLGNAGGLNGSRVMISGAGTELRLGFGGTFTSDIELSGGNALISGASTDRTLSGIISQSGATAYGVTYVNSAGGSTNTSHFVVTGANTYQGDTIIGGSTASTTVVQVSHSQGLGTGASNVVITGPAGNDRNTLELLGGITISDKTLTLNGKGNEGSLISRTGNNRWAGDVKLGTAEAPTVTVAFETELAIDGVISGDAAGGLNKRGGGALLLKNANTYTTGTVVQSGILAAGHNLAVGYQEEVAGSGSVELQGTSRLRVLEGISLQVDDLALNGTNRLMFDLGAPPAEASIFIHGSLSGEGNYFVDITSLDGFAHGDYLLLDAFDYTAFTGSFQLGIDTGLEGSTLSWVDGQLMLHAIPEAQHWLLLGMGALVLAVSARRQHRRNLQ